MCPVSTTHYSIFDDITLYIDSKGISANMLKASSKRRRTLKQIKEEKLAKEQVDAEIAAKLL